MPFVANGQPAYVHPSACVSTIDGMPEERFRNVFASDAIRSTVTELRVGRTNYPLRVPSKATYIPVAGQFLVEGFSPTFIGYGDNLEAAREHWLLAVHSAFQELLYKRPFEMSDEDRLKWSVLSSRIDVATFRNRTPVLVRQFGRISKARPYPQEILWENGEKEEISPKQVVSPNFITFKPGQTFEAIVARDPLDFRLLEIVQIERRSPPSRLAAAEEAMLLDSIGSSSQLPMTGWD